MDSIDIVISFDSTGSMATCLGQVRNKIAETTNFLFDNIPNLRMGIINHGDYCDGEAYLTSLDLTDNRQKIVNFIKTSKATYGGDEDECYEAVLNHVRTMSWTGGKNKALVMIGDCNPHPYGYRYGGKTYNLDWKNELALLIEAGVTVYPIQCLDRHHCTIFYRTLAEKSNSVHLTLNQFADINHLIMAFCMQRAGKLNDYEQKLKGAASYNVLQNIDKLAGRVTRVAAKTEYSLHAVHPARFQVLDVDSNMPIKQFVQDNGLHFKVGRGFYEFTKPVIVQHYKEVIIQDKVTGEMFSGDKAREILGIPTGTAKVSPSFTKWRGFVQSTSANRKLLGGTKFLYEVDFSV